MTDKLLLSADVRRRPATHIGAVLGHEQALDPIEPPKPL
jgi:hypothetical protein